MKGNRIGMSGKLSLAFALAALALILSVSALADGAQNQEPVSYLDADGSTKQCNSYTELTGDTSNQGHEFPGGWYVVKAGENAVYNGKLSFNGDTYLILEDGAHITVSYQPNDLDNTIELILNNADNLTIYGQEAGTGTLTALNSDDCCYGIYAGTVIVNGGTIDGGETGNSKIGTNDGLTLNPNGTNSHFRVSGISGETTVTVVEGKSMIDGNGTYYTGTLTEAETAAIAGKMLYKGPAAYTVTLDALIPEGALTASRFIGVAGMTITLTGRYDYDISAVTVKDGSEQTVSLTHDGQIWSFAMPASNVTVTATAKKKRVPVSGRYEVTASTILLGMQLTGDTVINLAEGTTLTVNGGESQYDESTGVYTNTGNAIEGDYALTIQGAGTLVLQGEGYGIAVKNLTIKGGSIQDESVWGCFATVSTAVTGGSFTGWIDSDGTTEISGGTVSGNVTRAIHITGGSVSGEINGWGRSVTITGGQVSTTRLLSNNPWGGTKGPITLGCTNDNDFIAITSIGDCTSVSIAEGQIIFDEAGHAYTGTLEQIDALAGQTLRKYPPIGTPDFILPADIKSIEANAFEGVTSMTVVDAKNCTYIGAKAFKGCTGLQQIWLPGDCKIEPNAFTGCGIVCIFAPAVGKTAESCSQITDPCVVLIPVAETTQSN